MKYYLKNAILPFIYLFFMAITAFGILMIKDLVWLKVILCILNLSLYCVIVFVYAFKLGQDGIKVRTANDLERRNIVLTGEARPLKLSEEYKPYKGFIIGLMTCAPLLLLLVAHTIMFLCGGGNIFGVISSFIYLMVYAFFRLGETPVTPYVFYWTLFAVLIITVVVGVAYILGARKIELQQEKIKENQRRIYGE